MDRYKFILNSFKLVNVQPYVFIPGRPLGSTRESFNDLPAQEQYPKMNTSGPGKEIYSKQLLGMPVWADIILTHDQQGGTEVQMIQVLCTVNQQKNIVKTSIQGRNGTVKEYISDGDYQVTINGGFFDPNHERYPIEDVNKLIELCKLPEGLKVTSEFLQLFSIHYLVIESYNFPQVQGKQNVQTFSLNTISDEPIELQLAEENA